jgi:hypothetical protein
MIWCFALCEAEKKEKKKTRFAEFGNETDDK